MTQLKLDPEACEAHLNCYYDGIHGALEALSAGHPVLFWRWFKFPAAHMVDVLDYFKMFLDYNKNRESSILVSDPSVLVRLIRAEKNFVSQHAWNKTLSPYKECRELIGRLFEYGRFSGQKGYRFDKMTNQLQQVDISDIESGRWHGEAWGPHAFIKSLNVRYCPYCNAESVYAVKLGGDGSSDGVRSDIDHFYPKSECPYLGLSLQNLIPACTRCNRDIKKNREFDVGRMLNPYEASVHRNVAFDYELTDCSSGWCPRDMNGFELSLPMRKDADPAFGPRARELVDFFRVSRIYNLLFKPEAFDVIRLGRMFHSEYQGWVRQTLGDLSDEEINRLVCHVVPADDEINKWRLSKLAVDMKEAVGRILRKDVASGLGRE